MKEEEKKEMYEQFEAKKKKKKGVECWSARELAQVWSYSQWLILEKMLYFCHKLIK